jgi:hypothetical protein
MILLDGFQECKVRTLAIEVVNEHTGLQLLSLNYSALNSLSVRIPVLGLRYRDVFWIQTASNS